MSEELVRAMLNTDPDVRHWYMTDAEFRATVEFVAQAVIPSLLQGTMIRCADAKAQREAHLEALMRGPSFPLA